MKVMSGLYVNMNDVIGDLALEYGIPVIPFEDLVALGKRVVLIYNLDSKAKRITFDTICYYIRLFISTPFGKKALYDIVTK